MERSRFIWLWWKRIGVDVASWHRRPLPLILGALAVCSLIWVIWMVYDNFWVDPHQKLAAERIAPSWKRELTQKESYELQNSIRQTFVQALGGVALFLSFYLTIWTLCISQKPLQTNQETLRVTQEGQITERFNQAIEHLGDTEPLMIRLGGIYALERIARDSATDHWPVIEILTAYVRVNAPWPPKEGASLPDGQTFDNPSLEISTPASSTTVDPAFRQIPIDIQAVLTVLGQRIQSFDREGDKYLDLHETDLRDAILPDAHLGMVYLYRAHLENTYLQGAQLQYAILTDAYLERADFTGAHLERADFTDAHLEGADFAEAHLEGATGLTVAQLVTVRTLRGAGLDPQLKEEIQHRAPHLLQRPA